MAEINGEDELWSMAVLDPIDISAAGIALHLFVMTDPMTLYLMLRSVMGFCDCDSPACKEGRAMRIELIANQQPIREQIVTPGEVVDTQRRVAVILDWFDNLLSFVTKED